MAEQAQAAVPEPCKRNVSGPGPLELRAKQILSSDFLAPTIWGAPVSRSPAALHSASVAGARSCACAGACVRKGLGRQWPQSHGARALRSVRRRHGRLLGGCDAVSGVQCDQHRDGVAVGAQPARPYAGRARTSIHRRRSREKSTISSASTRAEPFQVPLSTAVGPQCAVPVGFAAGLVCPEPELPPERLWRRKRVPHVKSGKTRYTFVDGGYVDNSGVATALNIAQYLDARPAAAECRIQGDHDFGPVGTPRTACSSIRRWIATAGRSSRRSMPRINRARGVDTRRSSMRRSRPRPGLNVTETGFYYGSSNPAVGLAAFRRVAQLHGAVQGRCRALPRQ